MTEFLSDADLHKLTGYKRAPEQRQVLSEQGIPFRAVGKRTVVLTTHIQAWVEGHPIRRHAAPNMDAVR